MKCQLCEKELTGRQTKFCSKKCKNKTSNFIHQVHVAQKLRGTRRKLLLMRKFDFKCQNCGYDKNISALAFHHRDPKTKELDLSTNFCANRKMSTLLAEAEKCDLLCMNCHTALHNPTWSKENLADQIKQIGEYGNAPLTEAYEASRDTYLSIPV